MHGLIHSNLKYLHSILFAFDKLQKKFIWSAFNINQIK